MIRRSPRKPRSFTVVDNSIIYNRELSMRARLLLIWLLSKPDDWEVINSYIYTQFKEGRDAINAVMRELREAGYIIRTKTNGPDGKFVYDFTVYDEPCAEDGNPDPGQPVTGFQGLVSRQLLRTDNPATDFQETEDPFMEPAPLSPSSEYVNPIEERERILKEPPHSKHTKDSATCNATYLQEGIRMYRAYRTAWEEKYGSPSAVNPAGPGLLQALIEEHTPERIALALQRFFDNGDAYTKRARHPITLFAKQATNYLIDIPEESFRSPLTEAQKKVMQMGLDALKRRK